MVKRGYFDFFLDLSHEEQLEEGINEFGFLFWSEQGDESDRVEAKRLCKALLAEAKEEPVDSERLDMLSRVMHVSSSRSRGAEQYLKELDLVRAELESEKKDYDNADDDDSNNNAEQEQQQHDQHHYAFGLSAIQRLRDFTLARNV